MVDVNSQLILVLEVCDSMQGVINLKLVASVFFQPIHFFLNVKSKYINENFKYNYLILKTTRRYICAWYCILAYVLHASFSMFVLTVLYKSYYNKIQPLKHNTKL